jgi:peptide chain release factor 1
MTMLEKFQAIENKYLELENLISDPVVLADQSKWLQHTQAHAKLAPIVAKIREYKAVYAALADTNEMLRDKQLDDELKSLVQEELSSLKLQDEKLAEELRVLMLPKDPNDDKNVIVEIRGGAGGDEAALFAGDLFRMYTRYAETQGWRMEILDSSPTELGGFKEAIFVLEGTGAYSRLKFESGVHRVQRIPSTESGGRIHTSTVTVAVLPEAEDVDITINPGDIRIDTYRASGAGGQHINKTDSAIRITHLPTGIVVTCQDQKSQLKNKEQAMRVLRARVLEKAQSEQHAEVAETRKSQVGTGDRSERIRTYNFPQGRVTDHRIGLTLHKLDFILNGDLSELINALTAADQSERLQQVE